MNETEARDRAWMVVQSLQGHQPPASLVGAIQEALLKAQKDAIDHCVLQAMMARWAAREALFDNDGYSEKQRDAVRFTLTDLISDMHQMSSVCVGSGGKSFTFEADLPDQEFGGISESDIIASIDKTVAWF